MKQRTKRVHVPRSCSRCRRRLAYRTLTASWALGDGDGHIQGTVCPDCMTLEEMADMAIFEATREIGLNSDGRILSRTRRELLQ
ncbi:MAG TPA: hypothetical protein VNY55_15645 [Mycobacterium sp.]|nr:hypothetical protein [Mycobacterium sp.]